MVFGNNTPSDISKLSKIPRAAKSEWYLENFEILQAGIIAKYYVQVTLLLFYNRSRETFGNAQETFLFMIEKNKHRRLRSKQSFYINGRNDWQFFGETSTNHSRQTTWNSSMKVIIYKSLLLRSLQQWYNKATLLYHRFLLLPLFCRNSDAINQSNLRNFSAYIISIFITTYTASSTFFN